MVFVVAHYVCVYIFTWNMIVLHNMILNALQMLFMMALAASYVSSPELSIYRK